ncbi:PPE family protein [Mycobacterium sp. 663a-19]|uniref:PPE family protein n=1 Tax=Mycobacterium sp. 663a-19 TaxID=2986148 RepID=UPI002D1F13BD|nr:PPE family protein [Mycobacterium sp. 663a-19]MEB3981662.1 PPE family protein [Mycobacterium sp. 663a-19]
MTAPIWIAFPPEVHSTLLSSGPGPGPLLAAAAAWSALGTEYAAAADELTALLGAVQGGAWDGPSAERYVAAHAPYLSWLLESATKSSAAATLHTTAATAYTTALATMPTPAELAANHATHAALVATNFFGVNTIPIAVNEADYARMWVQAATTMTTYQAVSESALTAVPATTPAPQIVTPGGEVQAAAANTASETPTATSWQDELAKQLSDFTQNVLWPLGKEIYPNGWPIDAVPFANAVSSFFMQIPGMSPALATALGWFIFHSLMLVWPLVQTAQLGVMLAPVMIAAVSAAAAAGVAAAVAGAVSATAAAAAPAVSVPLATAPPTPMATTPAPTPTMSASTPANASSATASSPAPSVATASGGGPVGGGPGVGFGPTATDGIGTGISDSLYAVGLTGSSARNSASGRARGKSEEPAPDDVDAPAAAVAADKDRARARRRATAQDRAHRYEFMELHEPDPVHTSAQGAGSLGFAGATAKSGDPQPAGLITLAGDGLGEPPTLPMVPRSWDRD